MGYLDDDEHEYVDVRAHVRTPSHLESPEGSGHDTSLGVAALCLPIWGLGLLVFVWRLLTGALPFGADAPQPTAFQQAVLGLYALGGLAALVLAALVALLLVALLVRWLLDVWVALRRK
jgi:hypothetical protein